MLKTKILNEIKKVKIKNIVSISLVGSFIYLKKFEGVNDIDLIVYVKKLTQASFREINSEFKKITEKLSNKKINFIVENRTGPFKPKPLKNKKIIQLYLLLYDNDVWKNKKSRTTTFDWVNYSKPLIGKPLRKITKIKKLRKEDLIIDFQTSLANLSRKLAYTTKLKKMK